MRRLAYAAMTFATARTSIPAMRDERRVAYAVIELQNTWCEFARCLFLTYALGGREPNGSWVNHRLGGINRVGDAIEEASCFFNPKLRGARLIRRRDEPHWHPRTTLTRLVAHFGFSNAPDILTGLSVQTRLFDDLPPLRNFYSHKSGDSSRVARELARFYQVRTPRHPTDLVLSVEPGRPQSIGEDWVSELRDIVETLT